MTTDTNGIELKTDSSSTGYATEDKTIVDPSATPPAATAEIKSDDTYDEFGYKKVVDPKAEVKPAETKPEDKVEPKVEEIKPSSTGYDEEELKKAAEKVETKPEVKPEDVKPEGDKTDEEKAAEKVKEDAAKLVVDLTETIKDLPQGYDKEKTLEFATKNGFSVDQVKAYVEMEKAANADYNTSQEDAKAAQKKEYYTELKADALFGGENFAKSVKRVDDVLDAHMPNLRKTLTDKSGMMPPYLMKDLLAISKLLNPTATLVNGEPPAAPVVEKPFLEEMYK